MKDASETFADNTFNPHLSWEEMLFLLGAAAAVIPAESLDSAWTSAGASNAVAKPVKRGGEFPVTAAVNPADS